MAEQMSKRERVKAALNLQETDRTPIYDILFNDAVIERLTGHFPPLGEEGVRLKLEASAKILDMTRMMGWAPTAPGSWTDDDGFVHYRSERWISGGIRSRPFTNEVGARAHVEKLVERLRAPFDVRQYREKFLADTERFRHYLGDDTVILQEHGPGLDWIRMITGWELFSYLTVDAPDLIGDYLEAFTTRQIQIIHATADRGLSPCAFTYGDLAYKGKLMHSPGWLRQWFFPYLKRISDALHEHDVKCLFHSDGYIMEIIPDLIEAGSDGLNPIETVAGMDLAEVKRLYGDRLFLTGGIDISQLMSHGTPDQVRQVCEEAMAVASPGYFIGSTTELDNGSKPENILTMVETAWGRPVAAA